LVLETSVASSSKFDIVLCSEPVQAQFNYNSAD